MKAYNTENKTLRQVIDETKVIIDKYEINPRGRQLSYLKKYQDYTAILKDGQDRKSVV